MDTGKFIQSNRQTADNLIAKWQDYQKRNGLPGFPSEHELVKWSESTGISLPANVVAGFEISNYLGSGTKQPEAPQEDYKPPTRSRAGSLIGFAFAPMLLFRKQNEVMEYDNDFIKIAIRKKDEWLKNNKDKNYESKEFLDYVHGSLEDPEAPSLHDEVEKEFREKKPKNAEYYDKQAKKITKLEKDPNYWVTQKKVRDEIHDRVLAAGKKDSKEDWSKIRERIEEKHWNKFVDRFPEKAEAYKKDSEEIKSALGRQEIRKRTADYYATSTLGELEEAAKYGYYPVPQSVLDKKIAESTPEHEETHATAPPAPTVPPTQQSHTEHVQTSDVVNIPPTSQATERLEEATRVPHENMEPLNPPHETAEHASHTEAPAEPYAQREDAGQHPHESQPAAERRQPKKNPKQGRQPGARARSLLQNSSSFIKRFLLRSPLFWALLFIVLIIFIFFFMSGSSLPIPLGGGGSNNAQNGKGAGPAGQQSLTPIPGFTLTLSGPDIIDNGGDIAYNVQVFYDSSIATVPLEQITVYDDIPQGTTFQATSGVYHFEPTTNKVSWSLKETDNQQGFTLTLKPAKDDVSISNFLYAQAAAPSPTGPTPGQSAPPTGGVCSGGSNFCAVSSLKQYFGNDETKALKASIICKRESGGNPAALNKGCLTGVSADYSVGLFQINMLVQCPGAFSNYTINPPTCAVANQAKLDACVAKYSDPIENTKKMAEMSAGGTNWKPWYTPADTCGIN